MGVGQISVIIPVYNAEKYLRETVESVLQQTYSNFEIIAVNDGSTDRSLEILQAFEDPRIKIINKENTGVSDTRNMGIQAASGELVAFLDADDRYAPNYLQRMYETAAANDADMVVCSYETFRTEPKFIKAISSPVSVQSTDALIRAGVLTSIFTKLVKKSTLTKHGIFFDRNMSFGEDLFFGWKAFLASENVWMIDEKLYGYRLSESGATNKHHPKLYEKYKAAFEDLKAFGRTVNKDDEYTMDVFLATRIPSFALMTAREKSSLKQKQNRLLHILNDRTIQDVYKDWERFVSRISSTQVAFYEKCRNKNAWWLLLYGYKRNLSIQLKNKIKGLL